MKTTQLSLIEGKPSITLQVPSGSSPQETIQTFLQDIYADYAHIHKLALSITVDEYKLIPSSLLLERIVNHTLTQNPNDFK